MQLSRLRFFIVSVTFWSVTFLTVGLLFSESIFGQKNCKRMNYKSVSKIICSIIVAATIGSTTAQAQNLQSVSSYRKAHAQMLAKQQRINERIRLEEAQKYAQHLYEDEEPEPDIYTEGSGSS